MTADYFSPMPDPAVSPQPNWRRRRWILAVSIAGWFCLVVYFAHNRFLFDQWMPVTRADLVPEVQAQFSDVVLAMKEYQSIHGSLPASEQDLNPWFPNRGPNQQNERFWNVSIFNGRVSWRHRYGQIAYHFPPDQEGWTINGPIFNGPIPAPIVTLPATQPTTRH